MFADCNGCNVDDIKSRISATVRISTNEEDKDQDNKQLPCQNWQCVAGRVSKTKITTSGDSAILRFKSCLKELNARMFKKYVQNQ